MMRLQLAGIRKAFGATQALDHVDLSVEAGEVHAIIGENGAGKSTLMKVLSGAHGVDGGEIRLDGELVRFDDPRASQAAGIAMIYQELNLAPDLTVAQNISLGNEPRYADFRGRLRRFGLVDVRQQRERARLALASLHCEQIDVDCPVGKLSVAQQQMVEIARAIVTSADALKVLILDEPTSSLTQLDTDHLFEVISRLKNEGTSVLYISHFLEECEHIADRFTVLRDGRSVGMGVMPGSERSDDPPTPMKEIIRMMVGRDMSDLYPQFDHVPGDVIMNVQGLAGIESPEDVSFELRRGEILGIAGLIGAGRTETLRCLFGLDRFDRGELQIADQATAHRSPRMSWRRDRMGFVSEDRKDEGLFLNLSLVDNLTASRNDEYRRGPFLHDKALRSATEHWMERLAVKAASPDQSIGNLSGGNQQKIAFGRLLHHDCEILLLDEPTRGIDIGSKQTIYESIGRLASEGKAVVLVSSYLPELLGVCDRIAVMSRGKLVEIRDTASWDEHALLTAAIGATDAQAE